MSNAPVPAAAPGLPLVHPSSSAGLPFAIPQDPLLRQQMVRRLLGRISRLIDILDVLRPDPEAEASLGASEGHDGITRYHGASTDELEDDDDAEDGGDAEPSLGSLDLSDQRGWAQGANDDGEAGDDTGIGDSGGATEQSRRYLDGGGNLRAHQGWGR